MQLSISRLFHFICDEQLPAMMIMLKVLSAGEGVEDAEQGGGAIAQVKPHQHHHLADGDYKQAVLSLPVSEAHIAGVFKCESKHAETSKSLFNVTKIDVQCNHFDDK